MAGVIITAQVEDAVQWEKGFRTHGDLFRSQTVNKPIQFTILDNNEVAIYFQAADLEIYLAGLDSAATEEAMAFDGVKRETVKVFPLDKEFDPR